VTPTAKRSACSHCGEVVSASSTSNFRAHLVARHKQLLVKELSTDEVQNPSSISTLESLKEDFGCVEKYTGAAKRSIDAHFVKWCCKKRRGLAIGETDREFKSLLLQASRGRYSPPHHSVALKVLLGLKASADNVTTHKKTKLEVERIPPSISDKMKNFICLMFLIPLLRCINMPINVL